MPAGFIANCNRCETDFYPSPTGANGGLTCEKAIKIDKCIVYSENNKCTVCEEDYRPSTSGSVCEGESANKGCVEPTGLCSACRAFHWSVGFSTMGG